MRFRYAEYEEGRGKIVSRPTVPLTLRRKGVSIPVADALIDTGADQTLLPLAFAVQFGFHFDLKRDGEEWGGAGGGIFRVFLAPEPIEFVLEQRGFRTICWTGVVSFTLDQPMILLGHKGCLEHLHITCSGRRKMLEVSAA